MCRRQRRYGIGKARQLIVEADDGEAARRVEAFDRVDMPLKAELAQGSHMRRIAFKPNCLEAEFRGGEQQSTAAEANIEPGGIAIARADVACNGRNEGRDGAPSHFHIVAEGRRCKGAGSKIAVGEHVVAIFANMPLHLRRQFAAIGRVFAAIRTEKDFVRAAAAERACRIDVRAIRGSASDCCFTFSMVSQRRVGRLRRLPTFPTSANRPLQDDGKALRIEGRYCQPVETKTATQVRKQFGCTYEL